ncbi:hypothetical protein BKA81DRAFT_379418 [Phyllosticta paracitricarpa]|uniref:Uncharacterized protein n=1 Tax=Phyllosticta citricarpa TaxID=55181 RepID=A0ABR1M4F5_9PEZI
MDALSMARRSVSDVPDGGCFFSTALLGRALHRPSSGQDENDEGCGMSKMARGSTLFNNTAIQHKHQQLHTYIRTHPQFPLAGYVATGRPVQRRILQPGPVPSYRTSGSGAGLTFRPPDFPFPRQHDGVCPRKTDATRLTQPVSLFSQCELATQWAPWPLTDRLPLTTTPPAVVKNENKGNVERAESPTDYQIIWLAACPAAQTHNRIDADPPA